MGLVGPPAGARVATEGILLNFLDKGVPSRREARQNPKNARMGGNRPSRVEPLVAFLTFAWPVLGRLQIVPTQGPRLPKRGLRGDGMIDATRNP